MVQLFVQNQDMFHRLWWSDGTSSIYPSTWRLIEDKLRNQQESVVDPWNLLDSFTASAIYLKQLGGGTTWEYSAASRYYGGSNSYASSVRTKLGVFKNILIRENALVKD